MALFGRDYDRDYGYRGYDRGYRGTTGRGQRGATGYGADRGTGYYGGTTGYDRGYRGDRGSWFGGGGGSWWGSDRYDSNYKTREQTDFGDPFGDRQSQTPIRMIRERYDDSWFGGGRGSWFGSDDYDRSYRGYDRGYRGTTGRGAAGGYDRGYGGTTQGRTGGGVGYDPYEPRGTERSTRRGGGSDYWRNRDYDRGWF